MDKSTHVHASATPTGTVYATCKETVDVYIQIFMLQGLVSLARPSPQRWMYMYLALNYKWIKMRHVNAHLVVNDITFNDFVYIPM